MRTILNSKQALAGALFFMIGAIACAASFQYRMGTATNMGPGYFPAALSIVLMVLGGAAFLQAYLSGLHEPLVSLKLPPLIYVLSGLAIFALVLEHIGLPLSVIALVTCACADRLRSKLLEVTAIALVLAAFTSVLFIYVLNLPLRLL